MQPSADDALQSAYAQSAKCTKPSRKLCPNFATGFCAAGDDCTSWHPDYDIDGMVEDGYVEENNEEEQEVPVRQQKQPRPSTTSERAHVDDLDGLSSEPDELPVPSNPPNSLTTLGKRSSIAMPNSSSPTAVPTKHSKRIKRSMNDEDIITPVFNRENARQARSSPLRSLDDREGTHESDKSSKVDHRRDSDADRNFRYNGDEIQPVLASQSPHHDDSKIAGPNRNPPRDDSRKDDHSVKTNGCMDADTKHASKRSASPNSKKKKKTRVRNKESGRAANSDLPVRKVNHPAHVQNEWYCNLCDVDCNAESNYNSHMAGKKHKRREKSTKHHKANLEIELNYALNTNALDNGFVNEKDVPAVDLKQPIATLPAAASDHEDVTVSEPTPTHDNPSENAVRKPRLRTRFEDKPRKDRNEGETAPPEAENERNIGDISQAERDTGHHLRASQKTQRTDIISCNEPRDLETEKRLSDLPERVDHSLVDAGNRAQPEPLDPVLSLPPPPLLPELNCPEISSKMTVHHWRALRDVAFSGDKLDHLSFKVIQEFLLSPNLGIGSQHLQPFNDVMKIVSHFVSQEGGTKIRFSEYHPRLFGDIENDGTFNKYGVLSDEMSKAVEVFGDNLKYQFWRASPLDIFVNKEHALATKVPPRGRYGIQEIMPKEEIVRNRVDDVQTDPLFLELTFDEQHLSEIN